MKELTCWYCIHFNGCYWCRKGRFTKGRNDLIATCSDFERENMSNIKITAEVDGKQVPLENISTETFEAIKALEKPKEIPVVAIGNYKGELHSRRLFIKVNDSIRDPIVKHNATTVIINPKSGQVVNWWTGSESGDRKLYENVKPL